METEAFDVTPSTFNAESQLAVDAVLRPLEADVVTTSGLNRMETWSSAQ